MCPKYLQYLNSDACSIQFLYRLAMDYVNGSDLDDPGLTVLFVIQHVFSNPYLTLLSKGVEASFGSTTTGVFVIGAMFRWGPVGVCVGFS